MQCNVISITHLQQVLNRLRLIYNIPLAQELMRLRTILAVCTGIRFGIVVERKL